MTESNKPPNFLEKWKKVNFVCRVYQAKPDEYYSDPAPSYEIVHKRFTEIRCGRTSTATIQSPGCPNEITTLEMINKIHDIVLNDPKVKVRKIFEIVSI